MEISVKTVFVEIQKYPAARLAKMIWDIYFNDFSQRGFYSERQ
jgi:hypothetical protein